MTHVHNAGKNRVAIFGGSFNPPHIGHVLAATYVLACERVDRLLVVPCFQHPFSKSLAPFADRLEMCRLAFATVHQVEVSDVERDLGGESLTVRTLEYLHAKHPEWQLRLVVGSDVVMEMDKWTQPDRVRALAPPILLGRIGYTLPTGYTSMPALLPEVSSTEVREALRQHLEEPGENRVQGLVPLRALDYMKHHGLYGKPRS